MKNIAQILNQIYTGPSKWELDNIVYHDRLSNLSTFKSFLNRIQDLQENKEQISIDEDKELTLLLELLDEMDEDDIVNLTEQDEDDSKDAFIENLARKSALESLTIGRLNYDTLDKACRLSPNDFILCAKRTQDLMNSIQNLAIKGENLSKDVAGA